MEEQQEKQCTSSDLAYTQSDVMGLMQSLTDLAASVADTLRPVARVDVKSWRRMVQLTTTFIGENVDDIIAKMKDGKAGECMAMVVQLCEEFMIPAHMWAWDEYMGATKKQAAAYIELCEQLCDDPTLEEDEDDDCSLGCDCYCGDDSPEKGCCDDQSCTPFQRLQRPSGNSQSDDGPEVM